MSSPSASAVMKSLPDAPARSAQASAVGTVVPLMWAAELFFPGFSASIASKSYDRIAKLLIMAALGASILSLRKNAALWGAVP